MPQYRTRLMMELDGEAIVSVQTDKTLYRVEFDGTELTVLGPGVEETYFIGDDVPSGLAREPQALVAVLLWEDQV